MAGQHYLEAELIQLFRENSEIYEFIGAAALDGLWFWDLENPE